MSIVEANGLDIYYERTAKKEYKALFYIGGTASDLRNRPNILDSPLKENFEIIAYDQRGLGQTSQPEGKYTMQDYADDAAALLDALGIEQIDVLGVSFGGMVAQELVLRHPHKVSRLILACTSSGGQGGSSYPLHEMEALEGEEKVEKILQLYDLKITPMWIKENNEAWKKIKKVALEKGMGKSYSPGIFKQLMARKSHNTFDRLKEIKKPVFLAGGQFDGLCPLKNMETLQKNIIDSELKFYQGGHIFLAEDPDAFKDISHWLLK
jgi:3-oxoadipate enol-lactonase